MPSSPPHTTLPTPRLAEVEHLRTALIDYQTALQRTTTISGALATEILTLLSSAQIITDALRAERAILLVLEDQRANELLSHELLLALMGHVLRGVMDSQETRQQHGRIAGLRRRLEARADERAHHDLLVLLQQTDAALAGVAQAALQQRAQAQAVGLKPDGVLAAAARWHLTHQQTDSRWLGRQPLMRLVIPDEAMIEATEQLRQHGDAELLAVLDRHPAVAAVLINNAALTIPYRFCGKRRHYKPDAIVRLATRPLRANDQVPLHLEPFAEEPLLDRLQAGGGPDAADGGADLATMLGTAVFVVLEVRRSRDVRDQAQVAAAERWCATMSAARRWGHWLYLCCATVEELPERLETLAATHAGL
jgi:hypothetical protein